MMRRTHEQRQALEVSMQRYRIPVVHVKTNEGEDVDGAARAAIAKTTGTTVIEHFIEGDPLARYYLNFAGACELTQGQKAMIVVADDVAFESVSKLTQRDQNQLLAEAAGLASPTFITYARAVRRDVPHRVAEIIDGTTALKVVYEEEVQRAKARGASGTNASGSVADLRDRRFTREEIADAVREVAGGTDFLDAASEWVVKDGVTTNPLKADRIYTKEDNGLLRPWEKFTYCNLPFSKKKEFIEKAVREKDAGNASYCLVPDDTSTTITHYAINQSDDVLLFVGRPDYPKPDGSSEKRPNFGTLILGFGMSTEPLADALRTRGWDCTVLPSPKTHAAALDEIARLRERLAAYENERAA